MQVHPGIAGASTGQKARPNQPVPSIGGHQADVKQGRHTQQRHGPGGYGPPGRCEGHGKEQKANDHAAGADGLQGGPKNFDRSGDRRRLQGRNQGIGRDCNHHRRKKSPARSRRALPNLVSQHTRNNCSQAEGKKRKRVLKWHEPGNTQAFTLQRSSQQKQPQRAATVLSARFH